jgi:hypothetical protein
MRAILALTLAVFACDTAPTCADEPASLDQNGQQIVAYSQPPGEWCNRDKDCEGAEPLEEGKPQTADGWCLTWKNSCARPCQMGAGAATCMERYGVDQECEDVNGRNMCTR